jgi:hypothetical protein
VSATPAAAPPAAAPPAASTAAAATPAAATPAAATPAAATASATEESGDAEEACEEGFSAPVRAAPGKRILKSFELRYHLLRCGTHTKSNTMPALFPLSSSTPSALPVTRKCVRPLIASAIEALRAPGSATVEGGAARADTLESLLGSLPASPDPSISVLFNPCHSTLGPILKKFPEEALPGAVLYTGAEWRITVSPLVLVRVANPDPEACCREIDFGVRGRQLFRPAPGTAVPSGGRQRCCDPDVFVSATHGCFSLVAVPPKGAWRPEASVWAADPGQCIVLCGHDGRHLLPCALYHPRQNWDVVRSDDVKAAEACMSNTRARAWTIDEHWAYASARAVVRGCALSVCLVVGVVCRPLCAVPPALQPASASLHLPPPPPRLLNVRLGSRSTRCCTTMAAPTACNAVHARVRYASPFSTKSWLWSRPTRR